MNDGDSLVLRELPYTCLCYTFSDELAMLKRHKERLEEKIFEQYKTLPSPKKYVSRLKAFFTVMVTAADLLLVRSFELIINWTVVGVEFMTGVNGL